MYSTNHVHTYIYHVYCTRKYTLHLLFMVNNGVHPKIKKNIFCGIWWCEKMWKCNRKGRECVCLLHLYGFLKRDFYFIKVIKMGFYEFLYWQRWNHIYTCIRNLYPLRAFLLRIENLCSICKLNVIWKFIILVVFIFQIYFHRLIKTISIVIKQGTQNFLIVYIITQQRYIMWPLQNKFFTSFVIPLKRDRSNIFPGDTFLREKKWRF